MKAAPARAGFTMIELVVSVALFSVVMIGLVSLLLPLTRAQTFALREQTAHMSMAALQKLIETDLRQTTHLRLPSPLQSGGELHGCSNAAVTPGGSFPMPIDARQPMRWHAVCVRGDDLYYHRGQGCPGSYNCGHASMMRFAGRGQKIQLEFSRGPSLVEVSIELGLPERRLRARSAFALAMAAR